MREMGTVELLTRQGEIEIAKRLEDGLNQVKYYMAQFPPTMEKLLEVYEAVAVGDTRMQVFVVGFIDPNAPDEIKSPVKKWDAGDKSEEEEEVRRRHRTGSSRGCCSDDSHSTTLQEDIDVAREARQRRQENN